MCGTRLCGDKINAIISMGEGMGMYVWCLCIYPDSCFEARDVESFMLEHSRSVIGKEGVCLLIH